MLSRLIDVRPGEGPLAFKAFGALFGLIAGHTILETARDAIFLGILPASRLAIVYIALAVIGLVVPAYNSRYVRNFGRRNAAVFTLMLSAAGTTLWHFQEPGPIVAYGLYIWSGVLGTLLIVQFWLFAGQLFTLSQGKRLFPGIASGGVLGAVAGGLVAAGAVEVMALSGSSRAVSYLLLVAAAFFLGTAAVMTTIPTEDIGARLDAGERTGGLADGIRVLQEHRYVRYIAGFVALSTITVLITDYLFKYVAKSTVAPEALASFFARYYAVLNSVALVMQLLVAQRLVQQLGVVAALTLLPLLLLFGGASMLVLGGGLTMVLLTKGADGALRHSLHRVGTELLYLPLPDHVRDRSKALLEAVVARGAQALTAGAILILAGLGIGSVRLFATLLVVFAGAWILLTLAMRAGYLDLFRRELSRGALDPRLLRLEELDIDSVESVMSALSSTEPERVVAALDLLQQSGRARLIPALILYHHADEVLEKALDILARIDEQEWRPHAQRLLSTGSEPVRIAALRALGSVCEADLVREALDDPSPAVQAHAAFQLARCAGVDRPEEHPVVVSMLARVKSAPVEVRRQMRLAFVDALRVDADARWSDVMLEIAKSDRSPELVSAVAAALTRVSDERFIPLLVSWLDIRQARGAVREALARLGSPALDALEEKLRDDQAPLTLRRHIPVTIAAFGTQRAADLLLDQLAREKDGLLRYRVLRGLGRLVTAYTVVIDKELVEREVSRNLREHLRLMSLRIPLVAEVVPERARAAQLLLDGLLKDKMRQAMERAFRLFKVLYRKEDVRTIFVSLGSDDRRLRASALEFIDALTLDCGEECRALVRIVADDLDDAARVARAAEYLPPPPKNAAEAVSALYADNDEFVVALAAYYAMAVDAKDADVASLLDHRPSLAYVAEAAESLPPASLLRLSEALNG